MSDEDTNLMAEELGRLQEENKELKRRLDDGRGLQERLDWVELGAMLIRSFAWVLVVAGTLVLCSWLLHKWASTPDIPVFCMVDTDLNNRLYLRGVVPWHYDYDFGSVHNLRDGVEKAKLINCPMNKLEK